MDKTHPSASTPTIEKGANYLSTNVGMMAYDLERAFRRAIDARVARFGLSANTCRYLAVIRMRGGTTPKDFAEIFGVRSPSVLAVLRALEEKRLVRSTRDDSDARKRVYELTRRGAEIEAIVRTSAMEVEEAALRNLSEKQVDQLKHLVRLIRNSLAETLSPPLGDTDE